MTRMLTPRTYALFALLLSASLLIGAWIFQYGLGYAPCQMCYWQRHAHKAVVGVSLVVLMWQLTKSRSFTLGNIMIILAFLISAGLALWHVGVELGLIEPLPSCLGADVDPNAISTDDLLGSLDGHVKMPGCSAVPWSLFGISMAGYNAIFSLLGAALGAVALRRAKA